LPPDAGIGIKVTFGVIGYPAGAGAEPVWDIEEVKIYCQGSGGVWQEQGNKCVAPRVAPGPGAITPSSPPRDVLPVPAGSPVPPRPGVPTVPVQPPAMG
jgi:hypothetical protein